jgi:hypothetical protein
MYQDKPGPILTVTIRIPTQEGGRVYPGATEERVAHAARAFLIAFEAAGGRVGDGPQVELKYDYGCWVVPEHEITQAS